MNVLFLDHQGVMRLDEHPSPGKLISFDKECVNVLNSILIETNAEIVVSSDWKRWVSLQEMGDFYISQGVIKKPLAYTHKKENYIKEILNAQRAAEILDWLLENNVQKWIAIDDLNMKEYLTNFVFSEGDRGIKGIGVKDEILNFLL